MIVTEDEAIRIFAKLPKEMQSYYFHPRYITCDVLYKKETTPIFFVIEDGENIYYHALHLGKIPGTEYQDIQSPYGYGGPLFVGDSTFVNGAVQKYKEWCRQSNVLVEFIRFYPFYHNENRYYGDISENRRTVWIDLKIDDLLTSFQTRVRTAVRKAKKSNVKVIFSKDKKYILRFIELYKALMNQKNAGVDYYFNEMYFWSLINQEHVHLINAVDRQGNVIGASLFFTHGETVEYHLSTSNAEGRKMSVTNLLIYEFAEFAKDKNYKALYLGGGNTKEEDNSLLFFKRGFSPNLESFYIGHYIHNQEIYNRLKANHPDKVSEYILFYR